MVTLPHSDIELNATVIPQAPPLHLSLASDLKATPSTIQYKLLLAKINFQDLPQET